MRLIASLLIAVSMAVRLQGQPAQPGSAPKPQPPSGAEAQPPVMAKPQSAPAHEVQLSAPQRGQSPSARQGQPSSIQETSSEETLNLPVNLDRIRRALEQPPALKPLLLDERPTFRVQILERQRIEELLSSLNFKTTPPPAGGIYMAEMQRQWWPAVDNPLNQPYAAFNQAQLLTILIENLMGHYLGSRALNAVSAAQRAAAESTAREEVQQAVREYCAALPNHGAGIRICSTSER